MGALYEKLNIQQQRAVDALLTGATNTQAAEHAGVDRRTIHTWRKRDNFDAALLEMRRELSTRTRIRIQSLAPVAVSVLGQILQDPKQTTWNRIAAARTLLEAAQDSVELDDLHERLAELERPAPRLVAPSQPPRTIPADPVDLASRARAG